MFISEVRDAVVTSVTQLPVSRQTLETFYGVQFGTGLGLQIGKIRRGR